MDFGILSREILIKLKAVEFLAEDYAADYPTLIRYFQAITTKFILKKLSAKDRLTLYSILVNNDRDRALAFIRQRIPYLKKKLYIELKMNLEGIVK